MEQQISNININDKYISVYDLYYYIRNKLLQVGNNIVQNLNTTDNYTNVTESNKDIVVNCLSTVQNIFNNLIKDLYSSENIIKKQVNEKEIKNRFDGTAISLDRAGQYLIIPYLSYKGLLNYCNYQINQLYKKHYHDLISSKVNKLHNNIITTLNKVLSEDRINIEV